MRRVKMKDLAEAAGVSVMTVSRAFRSDASISPATRAKIREAADRLGYVFDSTAANLRSSRTGFVAVIVPSINNANFAETLRGLTDVLSENGYQVLLGYTNYQTDKEEELIEQFLSRRPDAIVLTGATHTDRSRQLLGNAGIPIIETWELPKDPLGHVVGFSNATAMQSMVDHLVESGRTRIGFLGGDAVEDPRGMDRRRGFVAAMTSKGLDASRVVDAGPAPISMGEGATAMAALLEKYPDTEAVMCVSDPCAFGALSTCLRRGLRVPDDIAVAGFGAYEIAALSVPSLTTIDAFARSIGEKAAKIILDCENSTGLPSMTRVEILPTLMPGESTEMPSS